VGLGRKLLLLERAVSGSYEMKDTFKVQCCNNIDPYYEYENGKTNINVKGRLKNSVHFWK
jgi:hypothetical protein